MPLQEAAIRELRDRSMSLDLYGVTWDSLQPCTLRLPASFPDRRRRSVQESWPGFWDGNSILDGVSGRVCGLNSVSSALVPNSSDCGMLDVAEPAGEVTAGGNSARGTVMITYDFECVSAR